MVFRVELQVVVSAKAHRRPIGLSRTIQLPFAPFPGLTLYGLMHDPELAVVIACAGFSLTGR